MIEQAIISEIKALDDMIDLAEKQIGNFEPGSLYINRKNGHDYYYRKITVGGKKRTEYLGTPFSEKVRHYKLQKLKRDNLRIMILNREILRDTLDKLQDRSLDTLASKMSQVYRMIPLNDQDLDELPAAPDQKLRELMEWAEADYERNPIPFKAVNLAMDGTPTRSKGDAIWYNLLKAAGIPFRYDCVMKFKNQYGRIVTRCPDFVIRCMDGTYILIEHLGMLENDNYAADILEKTRLYQLNGYNLGSNFFVTGDTGEHTTDSRAIAQLIGFLLPRIFGCVQ